jgi:hypothetical protein
MTTSTGTCARNLPQHFNGCTCIAVPGATTAEVEVDLMDPWADVPLHTDETFARADEPEDPDPAAPETVTVLDRHGKPVTLTPGVIDLEAKYAFTAGQCLAYAIATSEKTGWPLYIRMAHARVGRKRDPQDYVIHAMVQHPDGRLIDINGPREIGSWVESGHEIDPQVVPSDQARGLLKTHMVAMNRQDVDAAAHFVDPMLTEHGLADDVDYRPAHLSGMTVMTDHHSWPATASIHHVGAISDGWDTSADLYWRPYLRDAEFTLVSNFDLSRDAYATEPWEYTAGMDFDDDDEAEENTAEYEALADAIEAGDADVPPIVVVIDDAGKAQILDGNHRAGLSLARGIKTRPAYIARDLGTQKGY